MKLIGGALGGNGSGTRGGHGSIPISPRGGSDARKDAILNQLERYCEQVRALTGHVNARLVYEAALDAPRERPVGVEEDCARVAELEARLEHLALDHASEKTRLAARARDARLEAKRLRDRRAALANVQLVRAPVAGRVAEVRLRDTTPKGITVVVVPVEGPKRLRISVPWARLGQMGRPKPHASLRVRLYHDETKDVSLQEGKRHAHGILAVPETLVLEWPREELPLIDAEQDPWVLVPRTELLAGVRKIRAEVKYGRELHASKMTGKQWGKREACGRRVLSLACDYLRHKGPDGELPAPFFRFGALFFPPRTPRLREFYSGTDPERALKYFETLMRMAIKGVLHYGYTGLDRVFAGVEVEVLGLVLDGDEHLHRPIDEGCVIERLRPELRSGLSIAPEFEIRAVDSNPSVYADGTREHGDSELLQATDLLLGATRFIADGSYRGRCSPVSMVPKLHTKLGSRLEKIALVYQPFCEVLRKSAERRQRSSVAWKNSGHYRSFTVSRAEPESDGWQFWNIEWWLDEEAQLLVPLFPDA